MSANPTTYSCDVCKMLMSPDMNKWLRVTRGSDLFIMSSWTTGVRVVDALLGSIIKAQDGIAIESLDVCSIPCLDELHREYMMRLRETHPRQL